MQVMMGVLSFTTLALSSTCDYRPNHPHNFSFIGTREVGAFTLNICSDLNIGPLGNPNKPFILCTDVFICLTLVYCFWLNVKTATVLDNTIKCKHLLLKRLLILFNEPNNDGHPVARTKGNVLTTISNFLKFIGTMGIRFSTK